MNYYRKTSVLKSPTIYAQIEGHSREQNVRFYEEDTSRVASNSIVKIEDSDTTNVGFLTYTSFKTSKYCC